jgi:hypothetical protein
MSDQDTIFQQQTPVENKGSNENQNQLPTEVAELVGEGKKYADVNTALKALAASQQHIQTLEADNMKLKEAVGKAKTVDDILDVVNSRSSQSEESSQTQSISKDDVVTEVVNVLKGEAAQKSAADNIKSASDQLVAKVGGADEARKELDKKAAELGVGVDFLMSIAAKSPKAFMQYFGTAQAPVDSGSVSSDSSVNTNSMTVVRAAQEGTKEWWAAQRQEHGDNWYFAPAQAQKRLNDAARLGREGFFGKS